MAVETFATIDVGSYELAMKIFEVSKKGGIRELDHIRQRVSLGSDSYAHNKISNKNIEELCRTLREFSKVMKGYQVKNVKAYGTSAIREIANTPIVLDQIRQRTGIRIGVLSNSEQRFLDYKAVALKMQNFEKLIEEGAAILDIGGGSLQISLFEEGRLEITQNLKLGILRMSDELEAIGPRTSQIADLLSEMITDQIESFKSLYIKDKKIRNIIVVDDYVSQILRKRAFYQNGDVSESGIKQTVSEYAAFVYAIRYKTPEEIAGMLGIPEDRSPLLHIAAALVQNVATACSALEIYTPGVCLCDGIAYEYAQSGGKIPSTHDFEADILSSVDTISRRYMEDQKHNRVLETFSLQIFDAMKKIHGMSYRERLLLRIAVRLHNVGKYVSMENQGESAYHIILATEVIGLSHEEREMVASIVKYNQIPFEYQKEYANMNQIPHESELTVAKLTAILRCANSLDRSHRQKFEDIDVSLKDNQLQISVYTDNDIILEKSKLAANADFFEEIYAIRPVLIQKQK